MEYSSAKGVNDFKKLRDSILNVMLKFICYAPKNNKNEDNKQVNKEGKLENPSKTVNILNWTVFSFQKQKHNIYLLFLTYSTYQTTYRLYTRYGLFHTTDFDEFIYKLQSSLYCIYHQRKQEKKKKKIMYRTRRKGLDFLDKDC